MTLVCQRTVPRYGTRHYSDRWVEQVLRADTASLVISATNQPDARRRMEAATH